VYRNFFLAVLFVSTGCAQATKFKPGGVPFDFAGLGDDTDGPTIDLARPRDLGAAGDDLAQQGSNDDGGGGGSDGGSSSGDLAGGGGSTDLAGGGGTPDLAGGSTGNPDMANGNSAACAAAITGFTYDFNASNGGFTHQAMDGLAGNNTWDFDDWEWGDPGSALPCNSGKCWVTNLSDNYLQCQRAELRSPNIDLSQCGSTNVKLVFYQRYSWWSDGSIYFDGGTVEMSSDGGSTWSAVSTSYPGLISIRDNYLGYSCYPGFHLDLMDGYTQYSPNWMKVEMTIPPAMRTSQFRFHFAYASGVSYPTTNPSTSRQHTSWGWEIDDVSIQLQ
jgi:hypothetical protein